MAESDEFAAALERTLELLRNSRGGNTEWLEQVISRVETPLERYRKTGKFSIWGKCKLRVLFLSDIELQDKPDIEEIAEANGWEDEYAGIAEIVAEYLKWYL